MPYVIYYCTGNRTHAKPEMKIHWPDKIFRNKYLDQDLEIT